jgi:hypothetical protein
VRLSRVATGIAVVAVLVVGLALGMGAASLVQSQQPGPVAQAGTPTPPPTGASPSAPVPSGGPSESPTSSDAGSPTPEPTPTPSPTPVLIADVLTGIPEAPKLAKQHVIAVMIDDQFDARPQSGLSRASVVWQAPAEGGIPRYMALFSGGTPPTLGPVRSSRLYFIAWAAEWRAVYAHAGGSPQAMELLRSSKGQGKVVYNADALRGPSSPLFHRISTRFAPHNLYTDAKDFRKLPGRMGAKPIANPKPVWRFAPDAPLDQRPVGARLVVPYPYNKISYAYDAASNTWLRTVTGEGKQYDAAFRKKVRIAPKNVVVMAVPFVPIGDKKHRLDGEVVGSGKAWISTNGRTIQGTWKKKSFSAPTLFFDAKGNPVTLTMGQTFVQVVPRGTVLTIVKGKAPAGSTGASPSPSPSPSGFVTSGLAYL